MKNYLFVNHLGKKFKTTQTGKMAMQKHPKLSKTCKLLGECDEKGRLISPGAEPMSERTVESLKEIMTKRVEPVAEVEEKFQEPPIEKPKKNVKEKSKK